MKWIECIPNVSEGKDDRVILALSHLLQNQSRVQLLHVDQGKSANRTVFTFLVQPDALIDVGFQFIRLANELIDMRPQAGAHPRVGSVDVFPMVALGEFPEAELLPLASKLATKVSKELGHPIYLYEKSQCQQHRKRLEQIRKGGYEEFPEKIKQPNWKPDFGPAIMNPKHGVTVLGVRDLLVAINFSLNTTDINVAKDIANRIRTSGYIKDGERKHGLLPNVKAIGWTMPEYNCVQVSTNITNYKTTPIHQVFTAVNSLATVNGCKVNETELIGLIPKDALLAAGKYFEPSESNEGQLVELAKMHLKLTESMNGELEQRILDLDNLEF